MWAKAMKELFKWVLNGVVVWRYGGGGSRLKVSRVRTRRKQWFGANSWCLRFREESVSKFMQVEELRRKIIEVRRMG